jgi:Carbohydrate binding domain
MKLFNSSIISLASKLAAIASLGILVTACGGSDSGGSKKPLPVPASSSVAPSSTPASSTPASSVAPSSVVASSVAPSSVVASSVAPSSAAASSVAPNKVLKVDVTAPGSDNWHFQVLHDLPLGMDMTKNYKLKFKVKASVARTVIVQANRQAPDFTGYPNPNTIAATTEWQSVEWPFQPDVSDTTIQFQINLGKLTDQADVYQIWFDDVSFAEADGSNEQVSNGDMNDGLTGWTTTNNGQAGAGTISVEDDM